MGAFPDEPPTIFKAQTVQKKDNDKKLPDPSDKLLKVRAFSYENQLPVRNYMLFLKFFPLQNGFPLSEVLWEDLF